MKTRKQIFRNFQYLECDAFAEYLEGMAAKGWRFTGWKLGMIFEKEEPRKRVYAVEVFSKGREEEYQTVIENAWRKDSGKSYRFTQEDARRAEAFVDAHGIGNSQDENALMRFANEFLK